MQTSVLGDFTINSGGCWRSFVHFIQHSSFFRWGLSLKKQRGGKEIFLRASYIHTVGINRERAWYKSQSDKKNKKKKHSAYTMPLMARRGAVCQQNYAKINFMRFGQGWIMNSNEY